LDLGLAGKSVLITGGSRGIGLAVAQTFAAEGCDIHIAGRSKVDLKSAAAEIGGAVQFHVGDLRIADDLTKLAEACAGVDILVNNAGATPTGRIDEVSIEDWREGLELKVVATVALTQAIYAQMCKRGRGVIINVIGNCGERPDSDIIIATVTNTGMMGFTKALGSVSPEYGVRVVGVNPGATATERLIYIMRDKARDRTGDAENWRELLKPLPFGRASKPEEQAAMITFAASDRCAYVSGTILTVDAGIANRGHIF
jgi:NAD(P)-dependent dehydrogenase (short-subunit alcohol dehydrogenase family)